MQNLPSITLTNRQLCDLELLLNGGFAPLTGFLNETDYTSVVENMRLADGSLWSMPIVLSVSPDKIKGLNDKVALKDKYGLPLAILHIEDIYKPDLEKECRLVYGTNDTNHPYVKLIMQEPDNYYIGGTLEKLSLPVHYDFKDIRLTPAETKQYFQENGWDTVIGFQTRNPMHRSHMELTLNSAKEVGNNAKILIHPVVGVTQSCDVNYHTRVRCYKKLLEHYPPNLCKLSLLPIAMRMAGPREAMWHALIRKNYGCTHFVVGRDHAGPSYKDKNGNKFYGPYDAHNLLDKYADELGINIIKSVFIVYVKELEKYFKINEVPEGYQPVNISGTQQREMLRNGDPIPEWFSFPDVVEELRKEYRPLTKQGFCVYLSGLSGAGKTTLANGLKERLLELDSERKVTILDGDIVRTNLSKGLGFSKEDRSTNVRRIGYVASEIVKHGGICIAANIAPYEADRTVNRYTISAQGGYIEVYVSTSLEVCEQRDVKGLYAKARAGIIKQFTGISDPYEVPTNPELAVVGDGDLKEGVEKIVDKIRELGYL